MPFLVTLLWGQPPALTVYGMDGQGEMVLARSVPNPAATADYRRMSCRLAVWEAMLSLGRQNGWAPAGTSLDQADPSLLDGSTPLAVPDYVPESGPLYKRVLAKDAAAWARSLELALRQVEAGELQLNVKPGPVLLRPGSPDASLAAARPPDAAFLRDFIAFLRKGTFLFFIDDL